MATSQDANLFLPVALGGLGFRRLSDIIQERKQAIVDRLHESPMKLKVAVTAMINRARRHSQPGKGEKHVDLWASSLLEYATLGGANLSQPATLQRTTSCILDNRLHQLTGGEAVILNHLAGMRIMEVGDLTQWTIQDRRSWIPNVQHWDGLPPGLLSQELPQVGRILQVGQARTAFDSKGIQATTYIHRTCQIVQL